MEMVFLNAGALLHNLLEFGPFVLEPDLDL